jgi:hypothetical protein
MKTGFPSYCGLAALLFAGGLSFAQAPAPGAATGTDPSAVPARPGYGAGYRARQLAAANAASGAGTVAAAAASAPATPMGPRMGPGMGMGNGPGMGMGPGARGGRGGMSGAGYTPGWMLMTPAERTEHQARLAATKTYEECAAAMAEHRESMAARAKERGLTLPTPRRDACAAMKR